VHIKSPHKPKFAGAAHPYWGCAVLFTFWVRERPCLGRSSAADLGGAELADQVGGVDHGGIEVFDEDVCLGCVVRERHEGLAVLEQNRRMIRGAAEGTMGNDDVAGLLTECVLHALDQILAFLRCTTGHREVAATWDIFLHGSLLEIEQKTSTIARGTNIA
jgi:hypothetical protein